MSKLRSNIINTINGRVQISYMICSEYCKENSKNMDLFYLTRFHVGHFWFLWSYYVSWTWSTFYIREVIMFGRSVLSPHHWLDRSITSSGELWFKLIFITEPDWGRLTQPLPRTEPGVVISVKFKSNSRHKNWFLNFNNNFNHL